MFLTEGLGCDTRIENGLGGIQVWRRRASVKGRIDTLLKIQRARFFWPKYQKFKFRRTGRLSFEVKTTLKLQKFDDLYSKTSVIFSQLSSSQKNADKK